MGQIVAKWEILGRDGEGQTMVESALILAIISIVTIAVLTQLGQGVTGIFTSVAGAF